MSDNYSLSLAPTTLGSNSLKNSIMMSALTRARCDNDDHVPNDLMVEYYTQRASMGVIVTEGTHISKEAVGWEDVPGIYSDEQVQGWKRVTDSVHAKGGKIYIQLWHQGRQSHSHFHNGQPPVSASDVTAKGNAHTKAGKFEYSQPRPLKLEEIPRLVDDWRKAARNARLAGFDGVEIHGANGYLLDQFQQSRTNKRTDRYGGSVENRFRLVGEVIEAVLKEFPKEQVGIKLSPNGEFGDMGSEDYVEQFEYAIKRIAEYQLSFIVLMALGFGFHKLGEPFLPEQALKVIKSVQGNDDSKRVTKLIANCGYSVQEGEELLKKKQADLICYGRLTITNPDLPERLANNYPLNEEQDMSVWYNFGTGKTGYTTYPKYQPSNE